MASRDTHSDTPLLPSEESRNGSNSFWNSTVSNATPVLVPSYGTSKHSGSSFGVDRKEKVDESSRNNQNKGFKQTQSPAENENIDRENSPSYQIFEESDGDVGSPIVQTQQEMEQGKKVVVVGQSHVGKTSLLHSLCDGRIDRDYKVTIGVDITSKVVIVQGRRVPLTFWDIAGTELFIKSRHVFHSGAKAVIVVYDVTSEDSFLAVHQWVDEVKLFSQSFVLAVVGNKADLDTARVVSTERGEVLALQLNALFYETSAVTRENVPLLFADMASALLSKMTVDLPVFGHSSAVNLDEDISLQEASGTVLIPHRKKRKCCCRCGCLVL